MATTPIEPNGAVVSVASLKPDTAYMEVPRCDACRWWQSFAPEIQPAKIGGLADVVVAAGLPILLQNLGACTRFECSGGEQVHDDSKLQVTRTGSGEATIVTEADFGCVQFEATS